MFLGSWGPSIEYVTLFLMIFDPPPPVTNCHKSWTPSGLIHTLTMKSKKNLVILYASKVLQIFVMMILLFLQFIGMTSINNCSKFSVLFLQQ